MLDTAYKPDSQSVFLPDEDVAVAVCVALSVLEVEADEADAVVV